MTVPLLVDGKEHQAQVFVASQAPDVETGAAGKSHDPIFRHPPSKIPLSKRFCASHTRIFGWGVADLATNRILHRPDTLRQTEYFQLPSGI